MVFGQEKERSKLMPEVVEFAAAYLAVAWLVALAAGFFGEGDGDIVSTISLLWPLSLPVILLFVSALFIADFVDNRPNLKRVLSKVDNALNCVFIVFLQLISYVVTLIFRPHRLGLATRSFFKRMRGAACTREQ